MSQAIAAGARMCQSTFFFLPQEILFPVIVANESDVPEKLNDVRVKFLGKKGELTAVLKGMKDVAPEERPKVGQLVNETRAAIEELLDETKKKMDAAIREEKLKQEVIDVTLPSKKNTIVIRIRSLWKK